jgi:hypothetical protein
LNRKDAKAQSYEFLYADGRRLTQMILNLTAFGGGEPRSEELNLRSSASICG